MTFSKDNPTACSGNTQDEHSRDVTSVCSPWKRGRPARWRVEGTRCWSALAVVGVTTCLVIPGWNRLALTQSSAVTSLAVADTYLKQGAPNANQGAEILLRLQQGGNNRVLVKFDQQALEQAVGAAGVRSA